MSKGVSLDDESTYVGFNLESEADKRRVRMRTAQLGYSSIAAYVRDLVDEDLEDADLPEVGE